MDAPSLLVGLNCMENSPPSPWPPHCGGQRVVQWWGDKLRGFKKCFPVLIFTGLNKRKHSLYAQQTIHTQWQHLVVNEVCFKQIENFNGFEYVGVEFGPMFPWIWTQLAFSPGFNRLIVLIELDFSISWLFFSVTVNFHNQKPYANKDVDSECSFYRCS